jgi:hypothetical protein
VVISHVLRVFINHAAGGFCGIARSVGPHCARERIGYFCSSIVNRGGKIRFGTHPVLRNHQLSQILL